MKRGIAVLIAMLALVGGGWAIYHFRGQNATAESLVYISSYDLQPYSDSLRPLSAGEYRRRTYTLASLLEAAFVLESAARRLPPGSPSAEQLRDAVHVHTEEDSHVLRITFTAAESLNVTELLDAVVQAFLDEAVYAESKRSHQMAVVFREKVERIEEEVAQVGSHIEKLEDAGVASPDLEVRRARRDALLTELNDQMHWASRYDALLRVHEPVKLLQSAALVANSD